MHVTHQITKSLQKLAGIQCSPPSLPPLSLRTLPSTQPCLPPQPPRNALSRRSRLHRSLSPSTKHHPHPWRKKTSTRTFSSKKPSSSRMSTSSATSRTAGPLPRASQSGLVPLSPQPTYLRPRASVSSQPHAFHLISRVSSYTLVYVFLLLLFSWFCFVVFQQLEIDYVIGESHKELMPNSSGSAAIIRIFGVTREG